MRQQQLQIRSELPQQRYLYEVRYTASATDRVTFTATSAARVAYEVTDTKILYTASYAITVIAQLEFESCLLELFVAFLSDKLLTIFI